MSGADSRATLGLASDPFAADALPAFYFVGGQRRFQLQQAIHGLYIARSVVLLSGERGAGKSHLLAALRDELKGLADCCPIAASVLMDGVAIRRELAELYRLPQESALDNAALAAALLRQAPADAEPLPVALLIDDAHELAVSTLADLQQLVDVARGRVRLLLAGEPTLVAAWQQLPVAAAELLELQPLDLQESADYLQTRLQASGFRGVLPLSAEQMQKLYRASGGCIGKLNELAPAALAASDNDGGAVPAAAAIHLPWRWVGSTAAVLAVIGIAAWLLFDTTSSEEPSSLTGRTTVALPLPISSQPEVVGARAEPEPEPQQRRVSVLAPLPGSASVAVKERMPPGVATPVASPTAVVAPAPIASPLTSSVAESKVSQPVVVATAAETKAAVSAPVELSGPAASKVSPSQTYRFDEQRLLAMAAQEYVLQLMAVESRAKLEAFLKSNSVGVPTLRYEAIRGGKRLLVLVAGPYADRAAASAALAKLPASLRETKPWPRAVASIQSDIKAAHGGR